MTIVVHIESISRKVDVTTGQSFSSATMRLDDGQYFEAILEDHVADALLEMALQPSKAAEAIKASIPNPRAERAAVMPSVDIEEAEGPLVVQKPTNQTASAVPASPVEMLALLHSIVQQHHATVSPSALENKSEEKQRATERRQGDEEEDRTPSI